MSKYVPPSRRPGYIPPSTPSLPPGHIDRTSSFLLSELASHFDHEQSATLTLFNNHLIRCQPCIDTDAEDQRPNLDDEGGGEDHDEDSIPSLESTTRYPDPHHKKRNSPVHPLSHLISYFVVFPNAHPSWEQDHQLWIHTHAHLVMEDSQHLKKNFSRPIPVMKAFDGHRVVFQGWYMIESIEIIERGSEELRKLLMIKENKKSYRPGGRTRGAWTSSLHQQWIKVNLIPAPSSSPDYPSLENPMELKGGPEGDVARYLLEVGGLKEEIDILETMKKSIDDVDD